MSNALIFSQNLDLDSKFFIALLKIPPNIVNQLLIASQLTISGKVVYFGPFPNFFYFIPFSRSL